MTWQKHPQGFIKVLLSEFICFYCFSYLHNLNKSISVGRYCILKQLLAADFVFVPLSYFKESFSSLKCLNACTCIIMYNATFMQTHCTMYIYIYIFVVYSVYILIKLLYVGSTSLAAESKKMWTYATKLGDTHPDAQTCCHYYNNKGCPHLRVELRGPISRPLGQGLL